MAKNNKLNGHKICKTSQFPPYKRKKKKNTFAAAVPEECEPGMLLSYHKGRTITENNVFVFSSGALVTQCDAQKPLTTPPPPPTSKRTSTRN